ncbi:MAG: protein kinase [Eubacteriales bacterium]|nr:protein kinase [Eubacteriales bacterium]
MPTTEIPVFPGWKIIGDAIGEGSFGRVYEIHRTDGYRVEKAAMKWIRIPGNRLELEELRLDGLDEGYTEEYFARRVEEIRDEIAVMQKFVGDSHIVSYQDYMIIRHKGEIRWDILIRMELLTPLTKYNPEGVRFSEKSMTGDRQWPYPDDHTKTQRVFREGRRSAAYSPGAHPLPEKEIIRLGIEISQALMVCHKKGIIHRDIKPQNIFVNDAGYFKLGDFGIAREMPHSGSVMSFKGTVPYMAPETFAMRNTDARSDIYSLGMVLYRQLNGNREPLLSSSRFTEEERQAAQFHRLNGEKLPRPPKGSDALWKVLSRAVAPRPEDRYQTAEDFHAALSRILSPDENSFPDPADREEDNSVVPLHPEKPEWDWYQILVVFLSILAFVLFVIIIGLGIRYILRPGGNISGENVSSGSEDTAGTEDAPETGDAPEAEDISGAEDSAGKEDGAGTEDSSGKGNAEETGDALEAGNLPATDDASGSEDSGSVEESVPVTTTYTVRCIDADTDELLEMKTYVGTVGETLYVSGSDIMGYDIQDEVKSITLSAEEEENVIDFYYNEEVWMDIPGDALTYNGHSYYIYDDVETSLEDAQQKCIERGGYLAVINDERENEVLFQYMKDRGFETAFFGLTYEDGSWVYLYGDTSDFRDWGVNLRGVGQPNNVDKGDVDVMLDVFMENGYWNDVLYGRTDAYVANGRKYYNLHNYICEWNAAE